MYDSNENHKRQVNCWAIAAHAATTQCLLRKGQAKFCDDHYRVATASVKGGISCLPVDSEYIVA